MNIHNQNTIPLKVNAFQRGNLPRKVPSSKLRPWADSFTQKNPNISAQDLQVALAFVSLCIYILLTQPGWDWRAEVCLKITLGALQLTTRAKVRSFGVMCSGQTN